MESFKSLVENAVEGIFRTSPDGHYLYANPSLARIYGYASPEELKDSVTNIVKQLYVEPGRREQFVEEINRRGIVRDFISEIWKKDKTKIWIVENARAIKGPGGETVCYEGFVSDITDQMMMIERLRRSERMEAIGQLSAGIAHDFNNMLGAIRGYSEMLCAHPGLEETPRRYGETILKASERATELTRKLLAFSRKDDRKAKANEINKIVGEVAALLERSVGRSVKIKLDLKASKSSAVCDAGQLSNAILNLAVNARDAMPDGGTICISTSNEILDAPFRWCRPSDFRPGSYVKIEVRDTGSGMKLDGDERIFEPFFTTKPNGTGMGLASVYATVRKHDGSIDVESRLGEGSSFKLYIPLELKTAESASGAASSWASGAAMTRGSGKLLLADDNELSLGFLSEMLKGLGYETELCENGAKALESYKKSWRDFDMAILDVDMPEMDGVSAFKAMRQINPKLKAIFVTGLSDSAKSEEAATCGASALLRKPFDPRDLAKRISALSFEA